MDSGLEKKQQELLKSLLLTVMSSYDESRMQSVMDQFGDLAPEQIYNVLIEFAASNFLQYEDLGNDYDDHP